MSNRVMNRLGARVLTPDEIDRVAAGKCITTGVCNPVAALGNSAVHGFTDDSICTS